MKDLKSGPLIEPGSAGGTEAQRGFEFQAYALIYYLLLRYRTHPNLRMHVETLQDGMIEYLSSGGSAPKITEVLQCKKREQALSSVVRPLGGGDVATLGPFEMDDLKKCLSNEVVRLLTDQPSTFFTILVMGTLARHVKAFQPGGRDQVSDFYYREDFATTFPPDLVHGEDPASRPRDRFADQGTRSRTRALQMPSWGEIRIACQLLLEESPYLIGPSRARDALLALLTLYRQKATALAPERKVISGGDIAALLAEFASVRGCWLPVRDWLHFDNSYPANPNQGEPPCWHDLSSGRYLRRPQFDAALTALHDDHFVLVHGYSGAGKTTMARFLGFQYLSQNADGEAYFLQLSADQMLHEEVQFLRSRLQSPTLFIIDDEQFSPDETLKLVQVFFDSYLFGRTRARVVVTSTNTYSRRMLSDPQKRENPLTNAAEIRFTLSGKVELATLVDGIRRACGLRSPLSSDQISELSGGKLGLALLIARASNSRVQTVRRLVKRSSLKALLRDWILESAGVSDPGLFERLLVPVFIWRSFGLNPHPRHEGARILGLTGIVEAPVPIPSHASGLADPSLSFIITQQHDYAVVSAIQEFFDEDPKSLPTLCRRLAYDSFGYSALADFANGNYSRIIAAITDPNEPLRLGDVASILSSIYRADRAQGVRLLRTLVAPRGELRFDLLRSFLSLERTQRVTDLTSFLAILCRIDRQTTRLLVGGQIGIEELRFIVRLFEAPGSAVDEVALALRALHRASRPIAIQAFERLESSSIFQGKLEQLRKQKDALLTLLRYCAPLYPVQRRRIRQLLDESFTVDRIRDIIIEADHHGEILAFLMKLYRIRPKLVSKAIESLWEKNRLFLVSRSEEQLSIVDLTNQINLTSRLSRRVGRALALECGVQARKLARAEKDYQSLCSALFILRRIGGWRFAYDLCEELDRDKVLQAMSSEVHKINLVGISLKNLAEMNPELASWIESRLNLAHLLQGGAKAILFNFSYLIGGFLAAADPIRKPMLIEMCLREGSIREALSDAWNEERSLAHSLSNVYQLVTAGFSRREVLTLLGFASWQDFEDDVLARFLREASMLNIANELYYLSTLSGSIAEEALKQYVDRMAALLPQESAGQDKKLWPQRDRRSLPRDIEPNNLAELGLILRIGSTINPDHIFQLASLIDMKRFVAYAHAEPNLGRLAVFINGLHEVSRAILREFLGQISHADLWSRWFEENENISNVLALARTLSRVSKRTGEEFTALMVQTLEEEISSHIERQANLAQTANWLRTIHVVDPGFVGRHIAELLSASEFDASIWHLLQAAEAMIECERPHEAQEFCQQALAQARHIRSIRSLGDFLVILHKAIRIERDLKLNGFSRELFRQFDESSLQWLISRGTVEGRDDLPLVASYTVYLLSSLATDEMHSWARMAQQIRRPILDLATREKRVAYRALIQIFCSASEMDLFSTARAEGWLRPWEKGLAHIVFRVKNFSETSPFLDSIFPEVSHWPAMPPRELTVHSRNVDYGLVANLLFDADLGDSSFVESVRREAAERSADEVLPAVNWLLKGIKFDLAHLPLYYLWSLLGETVMRATYLPWEEEVEKTLIAERFEKLPLMDWAAMAG